MAAPSYTCEMIKKYVNPAKHFTSPWLRALEGPPEGLQLTKHSQGCRAVTRNQRAVPVRRRTGETGPACMRCVRVCCAVQLRLVQKVVFCLHLLFHLEKTAHHQRWNSDHCRSPIHQLHQNICGLKTRVRAELIVLLRLLNFLTLDVVLKKGSFLWRTF